MFLKLKDGTIYNFVKIRNIEVKDNLLNVEIQEEYRTKYKSIFIPLDSISFFNGIDFSIMDKKFSS